MELLKAGMLFFMGQVFRKKRQLKPPRSLTFQFLVEHLKHQKVIAFWFVMLQWAGPLLWVCVRVLYDSMSSKHLHVFLFHHYLTDMLIWVLWAHGFQMPFPMNFVQSFLHLLCKAVSHAVTALSWLLLFEKTQQIMSNVKSRQWFIEI